MNIERVIQTLQTMTAAELVAEFEGVFGRRPRNRAPAWLRKRIAFAIQERAYGGLSCLARAELERLAEDIELPSAPTQANVRRDTAKKPASGPQPGTTLTRTWHGREIRVEVVDCGFVHEGEHFKSLSAIAKHVTGQHWSGPRFFGLVERKAGA